MDDVLAYTDGSVEDHWKTVRSILEKLDKAGLYLDIDKCDFLCRACDRQDALSRRDQDRPHEVEDEGTAGRILQLLPTVPLYPVQIQEEEQELELEKTNDDDIVTDEILLGADWAGEANVFDDAELQVLWKEGVKNDNDWRWARNAVRAGERSFPPDLAIKMTANIAECAVTADDVLHGRDNRVWVPDYEPLRTAIMQKTHGSFLTGHPRRDTMIGILLRRWFWPKMRNSVRRFVRNCDVCGRTTVWREAKAGFLRSLPINFITDLPESQGCTNVMVITDRLSKDVF
ncbi:hypothetical protein K3495_g13979 [Podosphaera aphanis]|nr:hypothetical protein K3495_g13979 [Podosphaera aphanis]